MYLGIVRCVPVSRALAFGFEATFAVAATQTAIATDPGIGIKLGTTGNLSPPGNSQKRPWGKGGVMPGLHQNKTFTANPSPKNNAAPVTRPRQRANEISGLTSHRAEQTIGQGSDPNRKTDRPNMMFQKRTLHPVKQSQAQHSHNGEGCLL